MFSEMSMMMNIPHSLNDSSDTILFTDIIHK